MQASDRERRKRYKTNDRSELVLRGKTYEPEELAKRERAGNVLEKQKTQLKKAGF